MAPNLSINQLRTEGRHLTTQLTTLVPSTPEYQVVRQQLQVNQACLRAVEQAIRNLGNRDLGNLLSC